MIRSGTAAILPHGTAKFMRRRFAEIVGFVLLLLALLLLAALASFNPRDPSFNLATDAPPSNLLGAFGSYSAELLVHLLGVGAVLPVLGLAAWGWRLLCKRSMRWLMWQAVALLFATLTACAGLSALPDAESWSLVAGLGGVVGSGVLAVTLRIAAMALPEVTPAALAAPLIGTGIAAFVVGLGISLADWRGFGRSVGHGAAALRYGGTTLHRASRRIAAPFAWLFGGLGRGRLAEMEDRADDLEAGHFEATEGSAAGGRRPFVETKTLRSRSARKGTATEQPQFDFEQGHRYRLPPLDLLQEMPPPAGEDADSRIVLEGTAARLKTVLDDFGVRGEIGKVRPGPVITLYELEPAPGVKSARVIGLSDDIARSMSAIAARVAVIPGRNAIGIELPNRRREVVGLRELLASEALDHASGALILALGKDIAGAPVLVDLTRMPHLLIAGTTGSGKSVAINAMILSLLCRQSPEACKFIMIDPKMLELSVYDGIPHLLCPVVTEPGKAVVALKWTVREMEERYRAMSQLGVRNIASYNQRLQEAQRRGEKLARRVQTGFDDEGKPVIEDQPLSCEPLPLIVVVVDEMADLMLVAGKEIEAAVQRLSQMARAAGIHLIMATQRPSVDVITGTIKANFPTRISFQVTSKIDSRTILGEPGAEQLLGQGDMLFMAAGGRVTRVHGPFVSDQEVESVVGFLKAQGEPQYLPAVLEADFDESGSMNSPEEGADRDELYDEAVDLVSREGKVSTSFIQRRLQIGYNRAARLVERMEAEGLVSKSDRVGRREVLVGASEG